ncbi:hypothetical protein SCUCBS95973_004755 [Sporothrix curviconia]|uniref:Arrestin-like N-terminal domain-containing protein n=1 Tax=Sporothrix curviconia TaxID=1260050 RepID=A0ABP0BSY4_9PEZI
MKLSLSVDKPPNGTAFTAADAVRGRVELQLDEGIEAPEIRVILQGTAKTTLKPGFDAKAQIGDTRRRRNIKLFSVSQVVKTARRHAPRDDTEDDSDSSSLSGQRGPAATVVSGTFAIAFPPFSRYCKDGDSSSQPSKLPVCHLPPSTSFSTPGTRVRISYSVTAVCKRPGGRILSHLHLHKSLVSRQAINYVAPITEQLLCGPHMSLPPSSEVQLAQPVAGGGPDLALPSTPKLIRSTAWLPSDKLGLDGTHADANTSAGSPGLLPPYSPAMTLEVAMPYPPVITPGQPIALGVVLRTPRAMLDAAERQNTHIQLSSLSVRLKRQTQGRIGQSLRVDDTAWPMWAIRGSVPILHEKVDMSWGATNPGDNEATTAGNRLLLSVSAAAAIDNQPGFWTCFASRAYSIEVSVGITAAPSKTPGSAGRKKSRQPPVQYAKTALRVMVSDPPPDYEAVSEEG